ncbi:MAG: helix-hairpin-helix domain-containing protein [Dysgonamonadaceae bacterium]|jgi:DNA uptake protein ComE-like DNA-binding protein|nr:helix-hairpin-helix domain-containing protein [Dysgonamonadaceae bacterium]
MWKNFFYFTRKEQSGIVFLIVLIAGLFIVKHCFFKEKNQSVETAETSVPATAMQAPDTAITAPAATPRSEKRKYDTPNKRSQPAQQEKRTYFTPKPAAESVAKAEVKKFPATEKFPEGTVLNLNRIDTTELMKVPGIGKAYAARIVKYRQLLGGYYSVEQLKEVYNMYEELYDKIVPFFEVSPDSIRIIPANSASLDRMRSHPYFNFYQAKAIIELRKKNGRINSLDELALLEEFTEKDLERIKIYLSFD